MAMKTLPIATPALVAASNNKVVFDLAQISQGGSITNDNEHSDKSMKEHGCHRKVNDRTSSSSTSHSDISELSYLISKGLEIEFVEDDNVLQVADSTVGGSTNDLCSPRGPFDFDSTTSVNRQTNSTAKEGEDDQLLEGSNVNLPLSLPSLKSPPTCRRLSSTVQREHDGDQRPVIPFVLQREISGLDVNLSSSFDDDDSSNEKQQHEEYKKLLYGDDGVDNDNESKSSSWSLDSSFADVRSESGEDTYFSQSFDYETAASSSCGGAGSITPSAATVVMKNTNPNRRYYFFNDYSRSQSSFEQQQNHRHRRKRASFTNSSFEDVFEQEKRSSSFSTDENCKYLLTPMDALRWFDEDDDDNRVVVKNPDSYYELKEYIESRDGGEEDNGYLFRFSSGTNDESLSSVSTGGEHRKNNLSQHSWFSAVDAVIHEHENEDDDDDDNEEEMNDVQSSLIYVARSSSTSSSSDEEKQQDIFSSCRTSILDHDQAYNINTVVLKYNNNIKDNEHEDIGSDDDTESHLNGIELEDDDDDEVLSYSTAASSILLYDDDDEADDESYNGDEDHFDPSKHRRNTITNIGNKKKRHLLPPTTKTNKRRPWSAPSRVDTTAKRNLNDLDLLKGGRSGRNKRRNIFQCLFCPSSIV